jgi:hypothetical protein
MRGLALTLCLVAAAAPAFAQEQPDLTREFQAGIDAYRLGQYDEARTHLEKARDIDPRLPGPYRFLAAMWHAQGKWDECIKNAHKALELNSKSSEAADTRKLHEECRRSAGRAPFQGDLEDSAAVAVTTNVVGATVQINSLAYGATPLAPRPITPGELEVTIEKTGWKSKTVKVNAIAGIVTDVIVDLEADQNAQTNIQVETHEVSKIGWLMWPKAEATVIVDGKQTPPVERVELQPGTHTVELQAPGKDPWRRRFRITAGQRTTVEPTFIDSAGREVSESRGLYIVAGSGVFLVAGFVTAMESHDALADANDIVRIEKARNPAAPLEDIAPIRTRADLADATDRANRFALISNISYGIGIAGVGIGAYFLYKGARESHDPPPFALAPTHGGLFVAKELAW